MDAEQNTSKDDFYFYMAIILFVTLIGVIMMQILSQ